MCAAVVQNAVGRECSMLAFRGRYLKQAPEEDSTKPAVTDLEKGSIAARDKLYCGKMAGLRDVLWTVGIQE